MKQAEALVLQSEKAPALWSGDPVRDSEDRESLTGLLSAYFECVRRAVGEGRVLLIHSPEVPPEIFYAFPAVLPVLDELLPFFELFWGCPSGGGRDRMRWRRHCQNLCPLDRLKLAAVLSLQLDHRVLAVGTTSACDSNLAYLKVLESQCEDSVFLVDAPFRPDGPSEDLRERQVWDLVEFLAAKTGQPPDWSRCSEAMREANALSEAFLKLSRLERSGSFPFSNSFFFFKPLLQAAAASTPAGMRRAIRILRERIARNALPGDSGPWLRIGWLEMTPLSSLSFADLLETQVRAVTVAPLLPGIPIPRSRPSSLRELVRFTARNMGRHPCTRDLAMRLETSLAEIVQRIETCRVDAVLMTYQRPCLNVLSSLEPIEGLFRSMGIPFLKLQADPFASTRVVLSRSARLQAFLADCAARRRIRFSG